MVSLTTSVSGMNQVRCGPGDASSLWQVRIVSSADLGSSIAKENADYIWGLSGMGWNLGPGNDNGNGTSGSGSGVEGDDGSKLRVHWSCMGGFLRGREGIQDVEAVLRSLLVL